MPAAVRGENAARVVHPKLQPVVEIFEIWPAALLVFTGAVGLIAGSFLNVVAYRLPIMMDRSWRRQCAELQSEPAAPAPPHAGTPEQTFNLWWPRSACPGCGAPVTALQNVPVLSFLWLRGKCAHCAAKIPARYPIVEAVAAVLGIVVAHELGATWQTAAALGFTWTLLALTLIDLDHHLLPDSMTLPLLWAGLLLAAFGPRANPLFVDLHSAVVGAAAGYLALWSVYQLFKLATGKEGMGYGDFKLLAALGAWLGWQMLPLVIVLSAAVGTIVGIGMIVFGGHSRSTPIPFGPYLAGAGFVALLWGDRLVRLYETFATATAP